MLISLNKNAEVSNSLYIAIFILIYSSRETFVIGDSGNSMLKALGYVVMFFLTFYFIYRAKKMHKRNTLKSHVVILSALSLFACLFNFDLSVKYFYEILLFVLSSYVVTIVPFEKFKIVFSDIVYWLCIFAFATYITYLLIPGPFSYLPTVVNVVGQERHFCLFSVIGPEAYALPRNTGIFREPGVFIIYICLALMFELFNNKYNKRKVIFLFLSLLVTFSTSGYIVALFIIAACVFFSKGMKKKAKVAIIAFIFFLFIILSVVFEEYSLISYVFGKLTYENDSTDSRFGSVVANLYVIFLDIKNMLFGTGYSFMENSYADIARIVKAGDHNTNSVLRLVAVHGLLYAAVYYTFLLKFCKKYYRNMSLCVLLVFLMLFSNEDIMTSFLMYIFPLYGVAKYSQQVNIKQV